MGNEANVRIAVGSVDITDDAERLFSVDNRNANAFPFEAIFEQKSGSVERPTFRPCLLYTSDAADE